MCDKITGSVRNLSSQPLNVFDSEHIIYTFGIISLHIFNKKIAIPTGIIQ